MEMFDGALRMSGMLSDSIMMGIVNRSMEEAYHNVCSKEKDLECLNEKSKFCMLAVMQLEWCLNFVQDEMDTNAAGSNHELENLISDLTETRNRIQRRLEESELAISDKDRQLTEIVENEWKLRQAMETKDEELNYLRTTLELERTKSVRVKEFVFSNQVGGNVNRDNDFYELKNSVDQQFWSIKQKVEDGRVHLMNEVRKMNPSSSTTVKLETELDLVEEGTCSLGDMNYIVKSEEVQNDDWKEIQCYDNDKKSEIEVLNCCPKTGFGVTFEQIGADIDALKEMLELAFEMMDSAISLSKTEMMEQHWESTVEKETFAVVFGKFLKDVQENSKAEVVDGKRKLSSHLLSENWSLLMDDIKSLRDELELLVTQKEVHSKNLAGCQLGTSVPFPSKVGGAAKGLSRKNSMDVYPGDAPREGDCATTLQRSGRSDTSLRFEELFSPKCTPKEDPVGHASHVAEMIKNHESIIRQKSLEINWVKGEIVREKELPSVRKCKDFDTVKKKIPEVILRLDIIIKKNAKLDATQNYYQQVYDNELFLQDNLSEAEIEDREKEVGEISPNILPGDGEIKKLKEEREDLYIQTVLVEETYMILFKGLMNGLHLALDKYKTATLIKEDIYTIPNGAMVMEWKENLESYRIESFVREDVHRIVFSEVVKDIECTVNFAIVKCLETWNSSPSAKKFFESSSTGDGKNLIQEKDSLPQIFDPEESLGSNASSKLMESSHYIAFQEIDESDGPNILCEEILIEKDDALESVSSKLEKALRQMIMCREQLRELGSSLGIAVGNREEAHKQITSPKGTIRESEHALHLTTVDNQHTSFDSPVSVLLDFSKQISNFERMVHEKIGVNIARLEEVNWQLKPLTQHVTTLRKSELLYRKAFTRRCYDLQTAEVEVDLLGDEVDALRGLLEKAYVTLDHYSPVLQHYLGIMDILKLIRKALTGEAALTSLTVI